MTLVNARAAFETAIKNAVTTADNTVTVVFDNMPFTTPGKTKKYVMVNLDFTQSTNQSQGAAVDYYAGTIRCAIMTPSNKGSAVGAAIAETVITGLTSVNITTIDDIANFDNIADFDLAVYDDTFSVSPRVSEISGPSSVVTEDQSHFMSVINCDFTANA